MARRGVFLSIKTCHFLMSSLVRAKELGKSYEVFQRRRRLLAVYSFSAMINAYVIGGRDKDEVQLFLEMGKIGILPNVVTYKNVIHGLCWCVNLGEAFLFKERVIKNCMEPYIVTYGALINNLSKFENFDETNHLLQEMLESRKRI